MATVIILSYGEGRHLINKPADYQTLLDFTRVKFPELELVYDHEIAFHFTPEWFDGEVELDRNAFAEVHNRAVLRVTTTASPPAQRPDPVPSPFSDVEIGEDVFWTPIPGVSPPTWSTKLTVVYVPGERKACYYFRYSARLRVLMVRAAKDLGFDLDSSCFYFNNEDIETYDTPFGVGMEDGDLIEVDLFEV